MNTIRNILLAVTTVTYSLLITSCSKDDIGSPTITNIEVGVSNSHSGYQGSDLHIEAKIIAEGKIKNIRLLIHQESADEKNAAVSSTSEEEWVLDSTYTGIYASVKNTTFHEHVDIPANAITGTYHLHLYVTDLEGNQTMIEEEFEVNTPIADNNYPTITITTSPTNNQSFITGNTITVSGTVSDVQGLAGIYIGLVASNAGLDDSAVNASNSIAILHNHNFEDPKEYPFTAGIVVGASTDNDITPKAITWTSGSYYILVKVPGADGEVSFSAHYPVTVTIN